MSDGRSFTSYSTSTDVHLLLKRDISDTQLRALLQSKKAPAVISSFLPSPKQPN